MLMNNIKNLMEKLQWEPVGPNGNDPVFFFF